MEKTNQSVEKIKLTEIYDSLIDFYESEKELDNALNEKLMIQMQQQKHHFVQILFHMMILLKICIRLLPL